MYVHGCGQGDEVQHCRVGPPEGHIGHGVVCGHLAKLGAGERRAVVEVLLSAHDQRVLSVPVLVTDLYPPSVRPDLHRAQVRHPAGF